MSDRTEIISVRATPQELAAMQASAKAIGLPISVYIREASLGTSRLHLCVLCHEVITGRDYRSRIIREQDWDGELTERREHAHEGCYQSRNVSRAA